MNDATAPARVPATPTDAKKKAGRPAGSKATPALTESQLAVEISPADRAMLAEWAAVKGTTLEALAEGAVDRLLAHVRACIADYRAEREAFDREAAARIEATHKQ